MPLKIGNRIILTNTADAEHAAVRVYGAKYALDRAIKAKFGDGKTTVVAIDRPYKTSPGSIIAGGHFTAPGLRRGQVLGLGDDQECFASLDPRGDSIASIADASAYWCTVGRGASPGSFVYAILAWQDGFVVAGNFSRIGDIDANNIAYWDGAVWHPLGSGTDGMIECLAEYDGDLIVGGDFADAGGVGCDNVARWDGDAWHAMADGSYHSLRSLVICGGTLYGTIFQDGEDGQGVWTSRVGAWNGSSWDILGKSRFGEYGPYHEAIVTCLGDWNGTLVAGGYLLFEDEDGIHNVITWNGSAWSPIGTVDLWGDYGVSVSTIFVYDGKLTVAGYFDTAGDGDDADDCNNIASYSGSGSIWNPFDTGTSGGVSAALIIGGDLIIGGGFSSASGTPVNGAAIWNGEGWAAFGNNHIYGAMSVYGLLLLS